MDVTSHAGSPLRALVVHRGYWRWSVAAQMARLAPLMTALAFVLAGRYATGGYAVGGLMVTAYEVANVCGASFAGRFLDRRGPAVGAPRLLGLSALALTGLAAAVAFRAPAALLVLLAAIAGALAAGVGGGLRSLLSDAVPPRLLAPAIAIDATIIDMVVVAAPLLVLVAALVGPPGAIVAMAGASAVAALLVRGLRGAPDIAVSGVLPPPDRWAVWRNPRFVFWLLVSLAFGHTCGTAEIGALPLATRLGSGTGTAAGLVAALAATSALSGVAYAAFAHRLAVGAVTRACVLLALLILGCLALGLATGWATAAAAMIALGLYTAPLNTVRSQAAEGEAPPTQKAEAFSVLFAANNIGFALPGLLLAILPLSATLIAGGASGIVALAAASLLLRRR